MRNLRISLCGLAIITAGCASYYATSVPMTKAMRSHFQPYKTESGEARFVVRNMYFNSEDHRESQRKYDQWVSDWLAEYQYCRAGYEIIYNKREAFAASPELGGHLISHGRCR